VLSSLQNWNVFKGGHPIWLSFQSFLIGSPFSRLNFGCSATFDMPAWNRLLSSDMWCCAFEFSVRRCINSFVLCYYFENNSTVSVLFINRCVLWYCSRKSCRPKLLPLINDSFMSKGYSGYPNPYFFNLHCHLGLYIPCVQSLMNSVCIFELEINFRAWYWKGLTSLAGFPFEKPFLSLLGNGLLSFVNLFIP